jgi:hypothetical protein
MLAVQPIADNLKSELGSFFSTEAHSNNAILRYINSAVRDICIFRNFTFNKFTHSITVTAGTTTYTIPNQVDTFSVLDSSSDDMDLYNFQDYHRLKDKSKAVGIWDETFICSVPGTYTIIYQ